MKYSNKCNSNEEDKLANTSLLCLSRNKIGNIFNALSSQKREEKKKSLVLDFEGKNTTVVHCHMWEE